MATIRTEWCSTCDNTIPGGYYGKDSGRYIFCRDGLREWVVPKTKPVRLVISDEFIEGASVGRPRGVGASLNILWEMRGADIDTYENVWWYPEVLE